MEAIKQVWDYLIAIGFLPQAIVMALAAYGLGRWYYGINDLYLKNTALDENNTDTEKAQKAKDTNKALKIIKAVPILVGIIVTVAMQYKPNRIPADFIIGTCLGVAHAFMGVMLYDVLIEFKIFQKLEAKFIKTGE